MKLPINTRVSSTTWVKVKELKVLLNKEADKTLLHSPLMFLTRVPGRFQEWRSSFNTLFVGQELCNTKLIK